MAIKMIRLLFALPIDSREFVFLRKARERWGGVGRVPLTMIKKTTTTKNQNSAVRRVTTPSQN